MPAVKGRIEARTFGGALDDVGDLHFWAELATAW
jgi:hypothetical protein